MQRIYDKKEIAARIAGSKYRAVFDTLDAAFYLINYEKGELVSSPFQSEPLFQIVEQGAVNIYLIRDDGTRYSLSNGTADHFLGDMELFYPRSSNIYAEAAESLTCISFSIEKHRERLLSNNKFLSYMKYKCDEETLKGIEEAAFHLHCSARQLQRILNQSEAAGVVKKLGKGTYRLTESGEA